MGRTSTSTGSMSSDSVLFMMYCPLRFLRVICGGAAILDIVSVVLERSSSLTCSIYGIWYTSGVETR